MAGPAWTTPVDVRLVAQGVTGSSITAIVGGRTGPPRALVANVSRLALCPTIVTVWRSSDRIAPASSPAAAASAAAPPLPAPGSRHRRRDPGIVSWVPGVMASAARCPWRTFLQVDPLCIVGSCRGEPSVTGRFVQPMCSHPSLGSRRVPVYTAEVRNRLGATSTSSHRALLRTAELCVKPRGVVPPAAHGRTGTAVTTMLSW